MLKTWKEFYDFAVENYDIGGDGIVECWTEEDFLDFAKLNGGATKEKALVLFRMIDSARNDMWGF